MASRELSLTFSDSSCSPSSQGLCLEGAALENPLLCGILLVRVLLLSGEGSILWDASHPFPCLQLSALCTSHFPLPPSSPHPCLSSLSSGLRDGCVHAIIASSAPPWRQQAGPNKRSSPRAATEDPEEEAWHKAIGGGVPEDEFPRGPGESPREGANSRGGGAQQSVPGGLLEVKEGRVGEALTACLSADASPAARPSSNGMGPAVRQNESETTIASFFTLPRNT